MSGAFRAGTARVHLAALQRNGLCSNLCDATDDHAESRRSEFRSLIEQKLEDKKDKERKRRYQAFRLDQQENAEIQILERTKKRGKKSKTKQPKLVDFIKQTDAAAADLAVAKWALAHNIAPNAMQGPYWKRMHEKLRSVSPSYTPMYPKKIFNEIDKE